MQAKIRKYGGVVLAGALAIALVAGIAGGGSEAVSANLLGSNKGISILKDEPQRPPNGFKVESVVTEPNANRK